MFVKCQWQVGNPLARSKSATPMARSTNKTKQKHGGFKLATGKISVFFRSWHRTVFLGTIPTPTHDLKIHLCPFYTGTCINDRHTSSKSNSSSFTTKMEINSITSEGEHTFQRCIQRLLDKEGHMKGEIFG